LSISELAQAIHIPEQEVVHVVNEQGTMTPSIALRLAKLFGMSPDFWMNLQLRWDLYHVQQAERIDIDAIKPFVKAA
jgi:addiction module HigA family antidote